MFSSAIYLILFSSVIYLILFSSAIYLILFSSAIYPILFSSVIYLAVNRFSFHFSFFLKLSKNQNRSILICFKYYSGLLYIPSIVQVCYVHDIFWYTMYRSVMYLLLFRTAMYIMWPGSLAISSVLFLTASLPLIIRLIIKALFNSH